MGIIFFCFGLSGPHAATFGSQFFSPRGNRVYDPHLDSSKRTLLHLIDGMKEKKSSKLFIVSL
jgi:hypothetical protein